LAFVTLLLVQQGLLNGERIYQTQSGKKNIAGIKLTHDWLRQLDGFLTICQHHYSLSVRQQEACCKSRVVLKSNRAIYKPPRAIFLRKVAANQPTSYGEAYFAGLGSASWRV
jgi:hypothetical protein